jgi:collagenase-like PrtC family protease
MMKPELLSPAGSMDSLKAAVNSGCDAVYLGGKKFGARAYAGNFDLKELEEAERAVEAAEAKLDEYALAMEDGMGVQLQMTSAVTKKGK